MTLMTLKASLRLAELFFIFYTVIFNAHRDVKKTYIKMKDCYIH